MEKFSDYYLEEATKLWYGFDHIPKKRNALTDFIKKLRKAVGSDNERHVYFDDKYDYNKPNKQLMIKITDKGVIGKVVAALGDEYGFAATSKGWGTNKESGVSAHIQLSGGMRGSGVLPRFGEKQAVPSTEEQELGTIAYFNIARKGSTPTKEQISKEVDFQFDDIWMYNYERQWSHFSSWMSLTGSHKIHLDSGKNDSNIIIQTAKRLGLKDLKDNWNPADIWVMSIKGSQIKRDCSKMTKLLEFNSYLMEKFESREIVGVSLKKIGKPNKGKIDVVKPETLPTIDVKPGRVLFNAFNKNFILETIGNIKGFNLRVGYKAGTVKGDSDVRIYVEGRMAKSSVQLGGVSSKLFPYMAKDQGFDIVRYKKKMMKMSDEELVNELTRLRSKIRGGVVNDSTSMDDAMNATSPQLKAACFLSYYLYLFMNVDHKEFLKQCFYSATKRNDFSSVHVKVH